MNINVVEYILNNLSNTDGIASASVVSSDGLPVAVAANIAIDEDMIGAMTAAMMSVGARSAKDVLQGTLNHSIIHTDNGYMLLFQATEAILLVITTTRHARLGMVLVAARDAMQELLPHFVR